jgi:hypothetical protein
MVRKRCNSGRTAARLPIAEFAHKAAIVGDAHVPAVVALLDMAAERRGAARLDGGHDPTLPVGEGGSMVGAIGSTVAAEHIRHLQLGPHVAAALARRRHRDAQTVQRTVGICNEMGSNLGIAGGRRQARMTE